MSDASSQQAARAKRRWLPRFGMRAIFVLIGIAALAAWWVRGEVLKEQQREELVAEFSEGRNRLTFHPKAIPSWNRKIAAWLRGKPVVPKISKADINDIPLGSRFPEFAATFPKAKLYVGIYVDEARPEVLDALGDHPSVYCVHIRELVQLDDQTLARLSRIRAQTHLWLSIAEVDDNLLRSVQRAGVSVHVLASDWPDGGWQRVTDEGLQWAAKLPLHSVYAGRGAGDKGFAAFRDHAQAASVTLSGPQYTDASAEVLATLPNLQGLQLYNTAMSDAAIAKAITGRNIASLTVHDVRLGPLTVAALGKQGTLGMLNLKNVPLSPEEMAVIGKLPIWELTLDGPYDGATMAGLAPTAATLAYASLRVPQATDIGLEWLATANTASYVGLDDSQISATLLAKLPLPAARRSMSLGGPNINAAGLRAFTSAGGLDALSLYGPSIDDEALAGLQRPIANLGLCGTRVSISGLKALATHGAKVTVTISHPKGRPPFSGSEVAEIESATGGLVTVSFFEVDADQFEELLPQASREAATDVQSP